MWSIARSPVPDESDATGFSLLEVLVALASAALLSLGIIQMLSYQSKGIQNNQKIAARNDLESMVSSVIANPNAIITSATVDPRNAPLATCVNENGTCAASQQDFFLYDTAPDGTSKLIGGTTANPALYDTTGKYCGLATNANGTGGASPQCVIQVITSFAPQCPGGPPSCPNPNGVSISYLITQTNTAERSPAAGTPLTSHSSFHDFPLPLQLNEGGTVGFLAKFVNQTSLENSEIFQDPVSGMLTINSPPTTPPVLLRVGGATQAVAFLYSSDRRLKTDIRPLQSTLEKVEKLAAVSFHWKKGGKADIGFIAQDVEKIFPELVTTDAQGYKSVEYGNLVAALTDAFNVSRRAQEKQLASQQGRIEKLEHDLTALEARTKR